MNEKNTETKYVEGPQYLVPLEIAFFDPDNVWPEQFHTYLVNTGRKKKTVRAYLSDLKQFGLFYENSSEDRFSPDLLTNYDLRRFREWSLHEEKVSAATWNRRLATLRVFVEFAREAGYALELDPLEGIQAMKVMQKPPKWRTAAEFHRLMRVVEQQINTANTKLRKYRSRRDGAAVALMVYAGLRIGEVAALEWADIEISERKGSVIVRDGKGGKEREVPLSKEARRLIEPHRAQCSEQDVFQISERALQKQVAKLGKLAKIENLTPHQLRHTFGKRMADAGVRLEVIQALMGHEKLETTMLYIQPGWEDLEDAVDAVNRV